MKSSVCIHVHRLWLKVGTEEGMGRKGQQSQQAMGRQDKKDKRQRWWRRWRGRAVTDNIVELGLPQGQTRLRERKRGNET